MEGSRKKEEVERRKKSGDDYEEREKRRERRKQIRKVKGKVMDRIRLNVEAAVEERRQQGSCKAARQQSG